MPRAAEQPIYRRPRSRFWHVRWTRPDGRSVRVSSRTESYEEAAKLHASLKEGSGLAVADVFLRFLTQHRLKPRSRIVYAGYADNWAPFIGDLLLEQVNRTHIQRFVSERMRAVSHGTIRSHLYFLSSVFNFAAMLPNGPQQNPVAAFSKKLLRPADARVRWLSPPEVRALYGQLREPVQRLIVQVALETGMRKTEILRLQVRHLDLLGRRFLLPARNTKAGRVRVVPMARTLRRALVAHLRTLGPLAPGKWLFPGGREGQPLTEVDHWWKPALAGAGIEDFRFHDLRHHFASMYVQRGGRLQTLKEILGHSTIGQTEKYAHLAPDDAVREFRELEARA